MTKKNETKPGVDSFTVDSDETNASVPSVTRLLNRKKLGLTTTSENASAKTSRPPLPPRPILPPESGTATVAAEPATAGIEISTSNDGATDPIIQISGQPPTPAAKTVQPSIEVGKSSVQRATRRANKSAIQPLITWKLTQLEAGADPLGKGLAILLKRGGTSALFLAISPGAPGSNAPQFIATAGVASPSQMELWQGMKWDPTLVPNLWNYFVRTGYVELAPPGTGTNVTSNRNVVRCALGVGPDETLLLVRAGPANGCRGVIAIVSPKSLDHALSEALPLITAALPAQNAA